MRARQVALRAPSCRRTVAEAGCRRLVAAPRMVVERRTRWVRRTAAWIRCHTVVGERHIVVLQELHTVVAVCCTMALQLVVRHTAVHQERHTAVLQELHTAVLQERHTAVAAVCCTMVRQLAAHRIAVHQERHTAVLQERHTAVLQERHTAVAAVCCTMARQLVVHHIAVLHSLPHTHTRPMSIGGNPATRKASTRAGRTIRGRLAILCGRVATTVTSHRCRERQASERMANDEVRATVLNQNHHHNQSIPQ